MIYLLYGQDTLKGKRKLVEILDFFRAKAGNLSIFRIDGDSFRMAELEELLKSRMLFGDKYAVVCDRVLETSSAREFVAENIEKFADSRNIFIFFEETVEKEILGQLKERAEKIQEFGRLAPKTKEEYNPFPLCDAFARKDKSGAWALFGRALFRGVAAEEIFWKILWQVKNLLLVKKLSDAGVKNIQKESGLHPFVAKKTMSASRNFSDKELREYSSKLVKLYHDAREGRADFSIGLEKILIE